MALMEAFIFCRRNLRQNLVQVMNLRQGSQKQVDHTDQTGRQVCMTAAEKSYKGC